MDTPTLFVALAVLLAALATLGVVGVRAIRVLSATITGYSPGSSPDLAPILADVVALQTAQNDFQERMDRLTKAVAEGIDHVDRNEKRVRGILTGARNRFASAGYEDPGVEAEVESLPPVDEESGGEEELQPVPDDVDMGSWSSVPGMRRL